MNNLSLFDSVPAPKETVDAINAEMLQKGKSLPFLAEQFFIFGSGDKRARVAVVGESPGAPDIDSEKPFMGPVGQLLEKILLAVGLRRDECYLTNVVKIVSAGEEITPEILAFFVPYLHREIAAVSPEVVISLGNTPTKALLNVKKPISKVRGEFFDYAGMRVMPTFNPAYLLRDPTKKREVWEDMKKVRDLLAKKD